MAAGTGLKCVVPGDWFPQVDSQDGQEAKSPLLPLPCDLERESPRDVFVLKSADDDFTLNATLAVKLQEFGLNLPEEELDFDTAGEYLDWVKGLVADRTDWEVTDELYLATFAYSKLAMWRDLGIFKENDTDHPVVRTLAGAEPLEAGDPTPSASVRLLHSVVCNPDRRPETRGHGAHSFSREWVWHGRHPDREGSGSPSPDQRRHR